MPEQLSSKRTFPLCKAENRQLRHVSTAPCERCKAFSTSMLGHPVSARYRSCSWHLCWPAGLASGLARKFGHEAWNRDWNYTLRILRGRQPSQQALEPSSNLRRPELGPPRFLHAKTTTSLTKPSAKNIISYMGAPVNACTQNGASAFPWGAASKRIGNDEDAGYRRNARF